MKTYPESLLEIPQAAGEPAALPATGAVTTCFKEYSQFALAELQWVSRTVKQIKHSDDEDVFDHLYRRGHVVARLADLLGVPRAARLLSILDLVLDLARETGNFESYSMSYLVQLIVDTSVQLLDELGSKGSTSVEIEDIVGECRSYLTRALAEQNALQQSVRGDAAPARSVDTASTKAEVSSQPAIGAPAATPAIVSAPIRHEAPAARGVPIPKLAVVADTGTAGRIKILCVDDSDTVRNVLSKSLRPLDCEVSEARDGDAGHAMAVQLKPDLIILDYNIPGSVAMLRRLRENAALKRIPVIMLTVEASPEMKATAARFGVRDYINKPVREDQLLVKVGRIIRLPPS